MRRAVCLFAILAIWVPVSLASSKANKKGFTVTDPVQVQSVVLSPGHYEVSWMQMGSNVPVTIYKGHKALVTIPAASVVNQESPYEGNAVVTTKEPNGALELTGIEFSRIAVMLPAGSQPGR